MIQLKTIMDVADNTGAKLASCIQMLGDSRKRYGRVGDIVVANVKRADPGAAIKQGDVVKGVIVRTKEAIRREDGSFVRLARNAVEFLDVGGNTRRQLYLGTYTGHIRS